jgi:hypothetical protein
LTFDLLRANANYSCNPAREVLSPVREAAALLPPEGRFAATKPAYEAILERLEFDPLMTSGEVEV